MVIFHCYASSPEGISFTIYSDGSRPRWKTTKNQRKRVAPWRRGACHGAGVPCRRLQPERHLAQRFFSGLNIYKVGPQRCMIHI